MKNYYFKTDRIEYQNKILDTLDNALNDLIRDSKVINKNNNLYIPGSFIER